MLGYSPAFRGAFQCLSLFLFGVSWCLLVGFWCPSVAFWLFWCLFGWGLVFVFGGFDVFLVFPGVSGHPALPSILFFFCAQWACYMNLLKHSTQKHDKKKLWLPCSAKPGSIDPIITEWLVTSKVWLHLHGASILHIYEFIPRVTNLAH